MQRGSRIERVSVKILVTVAIMAIVCNWPALKTGVSAEAFPSAENTEKTQLQIIRELSRQQTNTDEQNLAISEKDRISLIDRYYLPSLERMEETERKKLVESKQCIQRIDALGLNVYDFDYPEENYKSIYNIVINENNSMPLLTETVAFSGETTSELNAFLQSNQGKIIEIHSQSLIADEILDIPSNITIHGNGVRVVPGETGSDYGIILNRVSYVYLSGFVIDQGFQYGIYVKYSDHFILADNEISGMSIKGIALIGDNQFFILKKNTVRQNCFGGVFIDGDASMGIIDSNELSGNTGMDNLAAGLALCGADIQNEDTALNPSGDNLLYEILKSPHYLVIINNTIDGNQSSGCYSTTGYCNYFIQNHILNNEKEGMCLDFGGVGNYVAYNLIRNNGGRYRMTDDDLARDFVLGFGRLEDGSSPAKLPGISIDNSAYNTFFSNLIIENYGCGIKAVRSCYRNTILNNILSDNNTGANEVFHFFGIELGSDLKPDTDVAGMDFSPCYENTIVRNTISGFHNSGIFYGVDAYYNECYDNTIMDSLYWAIESMSNKYNLTYNNHSDQENTGI